MSGEVPAPSRVCAKLNAQPCIWHRVIAYAGLRTGANCIISCVRGNCGRFVEHVGRDRWRHPGGRVEVVGDVPFAAGVIRRVPPGVVRSIGYELRGSQSMDALIPSASSFNVAAITSTRLMATFCTLGPAPQQDESCQTVPREVHRKFGAVMDLHRAFVMGLFRKRNQGVAPAGPHKTPLPWRARLSVLQNLIKRPTRSLGSASGSIIQCS